MTASVQFPVSSCKGGSGQGQVGKKPETKNRKLKASSPKPLYPPKLGNDIRSDFNSRSNSRTSMPSNRVPLILANSSSA